MPPLSDWLCANSNMDIKLNLIPPEKKEEFEKGKRLKTVIKSEIVLTVIALVFFLSLFSFGYILDIGLASEASLNSEVEKADQFGKIKDYDNRIEQANENTKQIAMIDRDQLYWSRVFIKLSQITPSGIAVKSFTTVDYSITISGTADTRDSLLDFKNKLEKETCFTEVNLPLSNLVDKDNVDFQIALKVKEDCLKKSSDKE